jgi:hypothetical protein
MAQRENTIWGVLSACILVGIFVAIAGFTLVQGELAAAGMFGWIALYL